MRRLVRVRKTEGAGDPFPFVFLTGKLLGLALVDELDPVFQTPEEEVGPRQELDVFPRHEARFPEPAEGFQGLPAPEERNLPRVNQLHGLDEELDFTNPAASQLDVVLSLPFEAVFLVDLQLHIADLLDGGEIEVSPVDEGMEGFEEDLTQGGVSGPVPRLDPDGPFPELAPRLVIDLHASQGVGDVSVLSVGTKAQIDAEPEAVGGLFGNEAGEVFRELSVEFRVGEGFSPVGGTGFPFFAVVDVDDVDIRAEVEFFSSQLPEVDDREVGADRPSFLFEHGGAELIGEDFPGVPEAGRHDHVRQVGHLQHGVLDAAEPSQLPQGDADRVIEAEDSNGPGKVFPGNAGRRLAPQADGKGVFRERVLKPMVRETPQKSGVSGEGLVDKRGEAEGVKEGAKEGGGVG